MAMKWNRLPEKEPKFSEDVIILNKLGNWSKGYLKSKSEDSAGKKYLFMDIIKGEEVDNVTHYLIPEPPKSNQ